MMDSLIYQPSASLTFPSFEKLTVEEKTKKNNKKMRKYYNDLPLILAAIVGVFLLVSNIVLLAFSVRMVSVVVEVKERVDRLHVPCSECSVPQTSVRKSFLTGRRKFNGSNTGSLTTKLGGGDDPNKASRGTPVESWTCCSTMQQMIHLQETVDQTFRHTKVLGGMLSSLTNNTMKTESKSKDIFAEIETSLKELETNLTSKIESSNHQQDIVFFNFRKNFQEHLNNTVDILQTSLKDVETNLTLEIDSANYEQEVVQARTMNTLDKVLNATSSSLNTEIHSKEQSVRLTSAMLNLTNTVQGLSQRIDEDRNDKPLNLKMCVKGKSCKIVDKSPSRHLCFKLSSERATWWDARQRCRALGGYLAELTDLDIHHFVISITNLNVWVGGTDRLHEGQWLWEHSGAEVNFTAWRDTQPDNRRNKEHCMQVDDGEWNDMPCSSKYVYLCEKADTENCESW